MIKDRLYTKYKFTKQDLNIIEKCFMIKPKKIEQFLDNLTQSEREKFFYKVQAKFLELIEKNRKYL